jgi:hypothetical protein
VQYAHVIAWQKQHKQHKQQKSPATEIPETQQGGPTHHIPKEPSATTGERQLLRPLDVILEKNPKRARESDGEYEEPNTTTTGGGSPDVGGRGAASLTTAIEEEKKVQAAAALWAIVQTTHGLQTRAGAADEVHRPKSPTTPLRQAIYGDLVRRDTIAQ